MDILNRIFRPQSQFQWIIPHGYCRLYIRTAAVIISKYLALLDLTASRGRTVTIHNPTIQGHPEEYVPLSICFLSSFLSSQGVYSCHCHLSLYHEGPKFTLVFCKAALRPCLLLKVIYEKVIFEYSINLKLAFYLVMNMNYLITAVNHTGIVLTEYTFRQIIIPSELFSVITDYK